MNVRDEMTLERSSSAGSRRLRERAAGAGRPPILGAAVVGVLVTLLLSVTSVLHFAYRSTSLHVAVETAAAAASVIAAQSIYGRFRRSLLGGDLALAVALIVYAASNLFFSLVPDVAGHHGGGFATWARVFGNLAATGVLAVAAFLPPRPVRHPAAAARRALAACAGVLAVIALGTALAGDALPVAVSPDAEPTGGPQLVGQPVVLSAQLLSTTLFAIAAVGFGMRSRRTGDAFLGWIAVAATLGGFARLNYFLFPSLYTSWFYAGDGLRLASFLALFTAGVTETRRVQQELAASAALDERRRMAHDLHDGVTQDLAYILQQLRHLAGSDGAVQPLVDAAERALDESRHAIAALVRPAVGPLGEAIADTAREVARREGVDVDVDVAADVVVPARTQREILRVVREALINAARHGAASRIRVELRDEPQLRVCVVDDGSGFDPGTPPVQGHVGLDSMAARVRAIGGQLAIESTPGRGTEVRVTLP